MQFTKTFFFIVFTFVSFVSFVKRGEAQTSKTYLPQKEQPSTCEYIKNALDYSIIEGRENEKLPIILIFRLGKNENSKSLLKSRMLLTEKYLSSKGANIDKFVLATSKNTNSLGSLDIYIRGEIKWQIYFGYKKNGANECIQ